MTPVIDFCADAVMYADALGGETEIINAGLEKVRVITVHGLECGAPDRQNVELTFRLPGGRTYTRTMPVDAFEGRRDLSMAIGNLSITVSGGGPEILALRKALPAHPNYSTGEEFAYSGMHEVGGQTLYVDKHICLTPGKGQVSGEGFALSKGFALSASCEAPSRTKNGMEELPAEQAARMIDLLHAYGPLDRCVAVIGYSMASLLNYHLEQLGYELPILFLTGESGAGKSKTIEYILQPLACASETNIIDASTSTKFTLFKLAALSNTIPMYIDEYKPSKFSPALRNLLSNFLRSVYSRGTMERGTKDQGIREYPARRPVVLAGENGFDEVALKTRSITCAFYQRDLTPERKEAFRQLADQEQALNAIGWQMLRYVLSLTPEEISEALDEVEQYVPEYINQERIKKNYEAILVGYMLFCKCFGISKDISAAAEALADSIYHNVMESSEVVENECIQFLRALSEMTEVSKALPCYLDCGYDYFYEAKSDTILFNYTEIYTKYNDYCHQAGAVALPNKDVKKQMWNNPQILVSKDKLREKKRCYEISLQALPKDVAEQFRLASGISGGQGAPEVSAEDALPFD